MSRHPLIAAALSAAFAFQLVLAGVGATCVMPAGRETSATPTVSGAMAGMAMPASPAADEGNSSDNSQRGESPCQQSLPTATCHAMGPCAGVFVARPIGQGDVTPRPAVRVTALAVAMPASLTSAPELPPPRV